MFEKEVKEILSGRHHIIRTPDQPYDGVDVLTERIALEQITDEAQGVRSVMLEVMRTKGRGVATKVERIRALWDPRRKSCSADHLVNGGLDVRMSAELSLIHI